MSVHFKEPKIIELSRIGGSSLGYISVAENKSSIPFEIKRVYWTYYTPQDVVRGGHAHKNLEQVIFSVSGTITFDVEDGNGKKHKISLSKPNEGLHLPAYSWREIQFSHNAVLLCLASELFDEDDYIRDYDEFKRCVK
jgi:dTDP-4-dehydrorhamnose 3,5-epimerase-like enzyme